MNQPAAAQVTGFSVEEFLAATAEDRGSIYQERATIIIGSGGQVLDTQVVGRWAIRLPPPPPPPSPILNLNEDPAGWARKFAENYYTTLYSNRGALAPLFQDDSMLTFQGHQIVGAHNIMATLITSLPYDCHHIVTAVDWQPSPASGGMFVFVSGGLHLSGEQQAQHKFTEMFHLIPTPQGGYYVLNDIFRLNGAWS